MDAYLAFCRLRAESKTPNTPRERIRIQSAERNEKVGVFQPINDANWEHVKCVETYNKYITHQMKIDAKVVAERETRAAQAQSNSGQ